MKENWRLYLGVFLMTYSVTLFTGILVRFIRTPKEK